MIKLDTIKSIVLIVLLVISALCLMSDNSKVFGFITILCAILYLLWNDDDNNEGIYNLKY